MTADGSSGPGSAAPASGEGGAGGIRAMGALLRDRLGASDLEARRSFTVAELRRSLLPYPLCRERLELASKAEYDVALLRLLADGTLLESDDGELLEEVEEELASPEPALGVLDDHAAAAVRPGRRLAGGAASAGDGGAGGRIAGDEREAREGGSRSAGDETPPAAVGMEEERPRAAKPSGAGPGVAREGDGAEAAASTPESCGVCGTGLPDAEGVRFCPACGTDVAVPRCGACGGELDAGWRYCPFCGSETGA